MQASSIVQTSMGVASPSPCGSGAGSAQVHGDRRVPLPRHMYTLLEWRLTSLGLNPKAIERQSPGLVAELRARCALCMDKRKCLEAMMDHGLPRGWEDYCPNAKTIHALCAGSGPCLALIAPISDRH